MTIQSFIEKAVAGGWTSKVYEAEAEMGLVNYEAVLLDPEAWKAVGKVEGWKGKVISQKIDPSTIEGVYEEYAVEGWYVRMHRMIDALADGKSIEQYLETL